MIAVFQCEPVSLKEIEEGEYLPSSSYQTAATPYGEPRGTQDVKTRYCPQIAEVHITGMISVSPDSYIVSYTEKH